jgi:hypothetical protein
MVVTTNKEFNLENIMILNRNHAKIIKPKL